MKATAPAPAGKPLTTAELAERIENVDAQLLEKEAERDRLRSTLPRLIAEHTGPEMAAAHERKQIADLTAYLDDLARTREALLAELVQAEQREADEAAAAAFARSETAAAKLCEAAAVLQHAITTVVSAATTLRGMDEDFCATLARTPLDFSPRQLSIALANRIQLSLYCASDGKLQVRGMFDSVHQLRESGRADIAKITAEYVGLGLRGNRPAAPAEPPKAA